MKQSQARSCTAFLLALPLLVAAPLAPAQDSNSAAVMQAQRANDMEQRRDLQRLNDQSGQDDLQEDRKRRKKQEQVGQAQGQEAKYPQATRAEPEGKASAQRTPQLKKLFEAYSAQDFATVVSLADALLADPEANPYERSSAARLAGASQLNTDNAKAQTYLKAAIDANGLSNNEHYESMLLVSQLQLQQQKYAESLATVDQFMAETKTQAPDALAAKGNALYRLKRYPDAVAALQQAVDAGGASAKPEWVQLLAASYSGMGKPEEAAKLVERVGGSAGSDTQSQLNLAATYMQAGQDAKAAEVLEKLRTGGQLTTEQDYKNLYAIYSNGDGKEKEVIAVINEGLQKGVLKPDHQTYVALAQAYWFSDQQAQAIEAFQKAAPLAADGETYLNLARALNNAGRAAEAAEAAKQALAKGIKKPEDANRIIGRN